VIEAGSVGPLLFEYLAEDIDETVLCSYTFTGETANRYTPPAPVRVTIGHPSAEFIFSGVFPIAAPPQAGGLTDIFFVAPSVALAEGKAITLRLQCQHSTQKFMTAVFTDLTGVKKQPLYYSSPRRCGVTDVCEWVLTGDESEIAKFTLPIWESRGPVPPAATGRQAWKNAMAEMAEKRQA
jgi:hypothetical protein